MKHIRGLFRAVGVATSVIIITATPITRAVDSYSVALDSSLVFATRSYPQEQLRGALLKGTSGNDTVNFFQGTIGISTNLADTIYGYEGNDILFANGGADELYGGEGHDKLYGGSGDDQLHGGDGSDQLFGGEGNDWLNGGPGADELYGGPGNDHIVTSVNSSGPLDQDQVFAGDGDDVITVSLDNHIHIHPGSGKNLIQIKGSIDRFKNALITGSGITITHADAEDTVSFSDVQQHELDIRHYRNNTDILSKSHGIRLATVRYNSPPDTEPDDNLQQLHAIRILGMP